MRTKDAMASYALTDVICHLGDEVNVGHYVEYNIQESTCFDDEHPPSSDLVTAAHLNKAKKSGYMYFYQRLDLAER